MVIIQDVFRYLLGPVEKRFKVWETTGGFKGKFAKFFRIGKVSPGVLETFAKFLNSYYMWLHFIAQRPWGPLYKRILEFDMHPTKLSMFFYTHLWFYGFWFGHRFIEDTYNPVSSANDHDYLLHYMNKYSRGFNYNILNWRTSAHYIEINRIYHYEMTKRLIQLGKEMEAEHERKKTLAIKS